MRYGQIVAGWTRSAQVLSARFASHAKRSTGRNAGAELTEGFFGKVSERSSGERQESLFSSTPRGRARCRGGQDSNL